MTSSAWDLKTQDGPGVWETFRYEELGWLQLNHLKANYGGTGRILNVFPRIVFIGGNSSYCGKSGVEMLTSQHS